MLKQKTIVPVDIEKDDIVSIYNGEIVQVERNNEVIYKNQEYCCQFCGKINDTAFGNKCLFCQMKDFPNNYDL